LFSKIDVPLSLLCVSFFLFFFFLHVCNVFLCNCNTTNGSSSLQNFVFFCNCNTTDSSSPLLQNLLFFSSSSFFFFCVILLWIKFVIYSFFIFVSPKSGVIGMSKKWTMWPLLCLRTELRLTQNSVSNTVSIAYPC